MASHHQFLLLFPQNLVGCAFLPVQIKKRAQVRRDMISEPVVVSPVATIPSPSPPLPPPPSQTSLFASMASVRRSKRPSMEVLLGMTTRRLNPSPFSSSTSLRVQERLVLTTLPLLVRYHLSILPMVLSHSTPRSDHWALASAFATLPTRLALLQLSGIGV